MNKITFCAFADLHEAAGYYNNAPQRLEKILKNAADHNVDAVLHCGDLCHGVTLTPGIVEQCDAFDKPFLHSIGNHECDGSSFEETIEAYHIPDGHYYRDVNGFRFIAYDANQMIHEGKMYHYSMKNYWHEPVGIRIPDVTIMDRLTDGQIDWMERTIMDSPYPCVLFGHHSFVRHIDALCPEERKKVQAMMRRVNADKQRVMLVICGHYHTDYLNFVDNVPYFELNSASNYYFNPGHNNFPAEVHENCPAASHTLIWNDPVHAIITLCDDGTVQIKGMDSSYYCDVSMESLGLPTIDRDGRPITPNVMTASFKLDMSGWDTINQ